jgi:hypothetical protein
VTPDQLSAIRERLDAATWDDWEPVHTIHKKNLVCDDMVGFQACGPIVFCTEGGLSSDAANELSYVHMDLIANAPTDLRALLDEVERLTHNLVQTEKHAQILEGSAKRLTDWQIAVAEGLGYLNRAEGQGGYEVADPETVIGAWREQEREVERLTTEIHASQAEVERLHADPLPAAAWVREVERAAFARGAEAMRATLSPYVSWGLDLADRIRDEPVPENK